MRRSALVVALTTATLFPTALAATADAIPVPTWTAPFAIGYAGKNNMYPQVSMGTGGDTTVGFSVYQDSAFAVQNHPAGGAWSSPTELSTAGKTPSEYRVATSPADDAAVALWTEQTPQPMPGMPGMTMPGPGTTMVASRAAGGNWGTPVALSGVGDSTRAPAIALGADGRAVAVWSATDTGVYASIRASDGTWSPKTLIGTGSAYVDAASVALRPDGSAVAVWERNSNVESAVLHGSTWSSVTNLGAGWTPMLGVDAAGNTTMSFQAGVGGNKEYVQTIDANDVWGAPVQLSVDGTQAYYQPTIGVAPDGTAIVAWAQSGNGSTHVIASRRLADGTWSTPAQVDASGSGSDMPAVTAFTGGRSASAWQSADTNSPLTASVFGFRGNYGWGPEIAVSGSQPGGYAQMSGDGAGTAVVGYLEDGSTSEVSFQDSSGPSLRALSVPSTADTGAAVNVSVDPRDAVSPVGDTTWDFGDGSPVETTTSAAHTYAASGTYTVTIASKDTAGNNTTKYRTIVVSDPAGGGQQSGGSTDEPTTTTATTPATSTTTTTKTAAPAPAPAPAAKPQQAPPTVMLAHTQKLTTVLARQAIRTTVVAPTAGTVSVTATVSKADAKKLGLKSTRLGVQTVKVANGKSVPVALKLGKATRTRAAKLKSLTVMLTVTFTAPDGTKTTTTTKLAARA